MYSHHRQMVKGCCRGKTMTTTMINMDSIPQRSLSLLLDFVMKKVTLDDAVKFHNDMVDLYFTYHGFPTELIQDMKIDAQMNFKEMWDESRSLLYWILFQLNKEVISDGLADDIYDKFYTAYRSDRVLIIR